MKQNNQKVAKDNKGKGINSKTICGIFCLILAVVLVLVAGIGSSWFTNGNILSWFNYWGKGDLNEPRQFLVDDSENDDGELKFETKYIPTSLFASRGIPKTAEAAYTLTVTEKDGGYVPELIWESDFVDPNSSWAQGKNASDYVTVTPDGENSATVACYGAFGEQIKITAKLASAPEVSVSRTADYVSRIESATTPFDVYEFLEVSEVALKLNITYGTGTVKGSFSNIDAYGELSDEAYNYITTSGTKAYPYYQQLLQKCGQSCSVKKQTLPLEILEDDDLIDNPVVYYYGFGNFFGAPTTNSSGFYNAYSNVLAALADNTSNQVRAKITFTYRYGDSYSETIEAVSPWATLDLESIMDNFPVTLAMSGADLVF